VKDIPEILSKLLKKYLFGIDQMYFGLDQWRK
jgi:hypothetical protein